MESDRRGKAEEQVNRLQLRIAKAEMEQKVETGQKASLLNNKLILRKSIGGETGSYQ